MEKNDKLILMVIMAYSPIIGGAERQAQKLAESLHKSGQKVEIITMNFRGLPQKDNINEIPVRRVGYFGHAFLQLTAALAMFFHILFNRNKIKIVHIHQGALCGAFAVLAAGLVGIPSLVKIGNSGYKFDLKLLREKYQPFWGSILSSIYVRKTNLFVAITNQIYDELVKDGVESDRIILIPNGVEMPSTVVDRKFLRSTLGIKEDIFCGVCVGRLNEVKNHEFLINVISLTQIDKIVIYCLGDGPLFDDLTRLIIRQNIQSRVMLLGNVENVDDFLLAADFFILPSKTEGLSNAVIEAMAHGLPVLISDIPSNEFIIGPKEKKRFLFPLDDVEKWTKRVIEIYRDVQERQKLGGATRSIAKNKFSIDKITTCYLQTYEKLWSNNSYC